MAITFPTTLDTFTNPAGTDLLENATSALDHDVQHSNANDAIEALEAKVGVNGSAVTTSHDYKLGEVTGSDKAVGKTATQTLTNKTLTSPTITGATATSTSVNGVTLSTAEGTTKFLRGDGTYATPTAGDASYSVKGSVQGLTDAATSGLTISSGVISVNDGTTANKILKLNSSAQIPAVDGSLLTNLTNPAIYKNGTTTYNLTTASGTQTIAHGLGKTPKFIRVKWILSVTDSGTDTRYRGDGVYNGTTVSSIQEGTNGAGGAGLYSNYIDTTNIINYNSGATGSDVQQRAVPTFDATNITLTWTKVNSPSGILNILWEAFA